MSKLPMSYAIGNLGRRPARTLLTGVACALVAAAIAGATAFVQGMHRGFSSASDPRTAIVLSSVAGRDVLRSTVSAATDSLVAADVAGIKRVGKDPLVSSEIHMGTNLLLGGSAEPQGTKYAAFVRGVTPIAFLVHQQVSITEGRPLQSGEILVGRLVAKKLGVDPAVLAVGKSVRFEGAEFKIVGQFASPGSTVESEIWAPLTELRGLTKRDDSSALFVSMEEPDNLADLAVFAQRRRDLELVSIPSESYYREMLAYFAPIQMLTWIMTLLIGGAVLATGANTFNTAVQDRMRELATLRAVGYGAGAIGWSLLQEAMLLAAAGGVTGILAAKLLISGSAFRIGMSAFEITVGPLPVVLGFCGALAIGVIGTVPAIIRAMRLPVAIALKEV
ncbi:MAG: FtsX-like permease family protein [Planctomycetes bacterium]|nr:FtsX-like permease family protein [Planctomycetota bacterium]